jgi:ABC-type uncharacterized transport system substrate-binding protein
MRKITAAFALALVAAAFTSPAKAHPHVWVEVTSQVVYDSAGAATGVRHAWKFDDMYSTFALQDLPQKNKGVFTREELAPLAEVNITSLKESDFFTYAKAGGKDVELGDASDYWLDYKNEVLTLSFTLPFKTPQRAKELTVEVYDPSFFVAFGFAEKDGVTLVGAPAQCAARIEKPKEQSRATNEAAFMAGNLGGSYASKIAVKCP